MQQEHNYIYRFRNSQKLLEFKELENQEIFFSDKAFQNDAFEGNMDLYWSGDEVLWTNFFNNYFMSLFLILFSTSKPTLLTEKDINIRPYKILDNMLPKDHVFNNLVQSIFNDNRVKKVLEFLSTEYKKIKKDELLVYLSCIHKYFFFFFISTTDLKKYIATEIDFNSVINVSETNSIDVLMNIIENNKNVDKLALKEKQKILCFKSLLSNMDYRNILYIENIFPFDYIEKLKQLTYPDLYISCFTDNCEQNSMWGNYADYHKGICLMFRSEKNSISLENLGDKNGYHSFELRKVNYSDNSIEIPFFESLGQNTHNETTKYWFFWNSNMSKFPPVQEIRNNKNTWRNKYHTFMDKLILRKDTSWDKEKELRIYDYDMLSEFKNNINFQKYRYKFSDLHGIIFGKNTSDEHKQKIISIIKDKLAKEKNDNFKFYQAYDINEFGKVQKYELTLLNESIRT